MYINGIDEKDNEIINLLLKDARMSYSDIGEKVGLSRTAVKNRVAVLEKNGIIGGYRAVINPQESPEMMTFIVNIETKAEHFDEAKQLFAEREETVTLIQTTGNCPILKALPKNEERSEISRRLSLIFLHRLKNTRARIYS